MRNLHTFNGCLGGLGGNGVEGEGGVAGKDVLADGVAVKKQVLFLEQKRGGK